MRAARFTVNRVCQRLKALEATAGVSHDVIVLDTVLDVLLDAVVAFLSNKVTLVLIAVAAVVLAAMAASGHL